MVRRGLRGVSAFLVITVVTPFTCAAIVLAALIFLPLPATLPQPKPSFDSQATKVYFAGGEYLGTYKQFETSIPVEQKDIPKVIKDAVVASEDRNFYSHGGIDVRGTLRALWADITNQRVVEGGSTITQQYVKQAFTGGERTISRKIREAILASQLDRQYDKDTILYKYLQTSYFGEGAYGIGAAAKTYFGKTVDQLSLSESALLASVLPAPTAYSPRDHPDVAEPRRVHVLDTMLELGLITQADHDAAVALPIWLEANGPEPPVPSTMVKAPETTESAEPWFANYVHEWLESHLPGCEPGNCPLIEQGGLSVVTTMDKEMQIKAEAAVSDAMGSNDLNLQMSLVSVEPPTGYIRTMVGGREWSYNQTNAATAKRQPGSSFKPYVLAEAFEQGIEPSAVYSAAPLTIGDFTIRGPGGSYNLRNGTWSSINAVYARLILDVGVDKAMQMAERLGAHLNYPYSNQLGASIALGVDEVSPLDMASAYGVFADHGKRAEPVPVLTVTDRDGKVLIDNSKAADGAQQVIAPVVADNVTDVLTGVLESGTAAGKGIDRPAAGKTGTAEDYANAWFVGYTPVLSTAVWMGHLDCGASTEQRDCGMHGINGVGSVTGGSIPASTWQRYMKAALADVKATEFAEPAPIQTYADAAKRAARGGFDPGAKKSPAGAGNGGTFLEDTPAPAAAAPTTSTSSTSTTVPPATVVPQPPTTKQPVLN